MDYTIFPINYCKNPTTQFSLSPMDVAPSEAIISASTVGLWLELLVEHPLVLCLSALNLAILCRTKVIHQNLRFLLVCQSASIALFECWTIWAPVEKLLNRNIFFAGSVASQVNDVNNLNPKIC